MLNRHATIGACVLGAFMLLAAGPASAKKLHVDDDLLDCPKAEFTSIQAAVAAASAGDKVKVCDGTYAEQVHITDDRLTLESKRAIIMAPPTYPSGKRAIVHIDDADHVRMKGFTVSGPWAEPGCSGGDSDPDSRHIGIYVDSSVDARLTKNHVTQIRAADPAFWSCPDGFAIQVGRDLTGSISSASVSYSRLDLYQKGGLVVSGSTSGVEISTAWVHHNKLVGDPRPGVGAVIAQNGIEFSEGAGGRANKNVVQVNRHDVPANPTAAAGIRVFDTSGPLRIDDNDLFQNDAGIALYKAHRLKIDNNESKGQAKVGGLFADSDTSDNVFERNRVFGNAEQDCHDDSVGGGTAGTANTWKGNAGAKGNKPGLCKPPKSGASGAKPPKPGASAAKPPKQDSSGPKPPEPGAAGVKPPKPGASGVKPPKPGVSGAKAASVAGVPTEQPPTDTGQPAPSSSSSKRAEPGPSSASSPGGRQAIREPLERSAGTPAAGSADSRARRDSQPTLAQLVRTSREDGPDFGFALAGLGLLLAAALLRRPGRGGRKAGPAEHRHRDSNPGFRRERAAS